MTVESAWNFFINHLIDEMTLDEDDDAKEAYDIICDFVESRIREEKK